jgi:hypothetical protein
MSVIFGVTMSNTDFLYIGIVLVGAGIALKGVFTKDKPQQETEYSKQTLKEYIAEKEKELQEMKNDPK